MFALAVKAFLKGKRHSSEDLMKSTQKSTCQHEHQCFRLVVMGAGHVGKTAIINRFLDKPYPDSHQPTVEEFHVVQLERNRVPQTVEILDTSGSYSFPAMQQLAIANGDAFILVYALDELETFETVKILHKQIREIKGDTETTPIVVVANKLDKEHLDNAYEMAMIETEVALDWDLAFIQASANLNVNIDEIFSRVGNFKRRTTKPGMAQKRRFSLPAFSTNGEENKSMDRSKSLSAQGADSNGS